MRLYGPVNDLLRHHGHDRFDVRDLVARALSTVLVDHARCAHHQEACLHRVLAHVSATLRGRIHVTKRPSCRYG
jgi:hypothetical protein